MYFNFMVVVFNYDHKTNKMGRASKDARSILAIFCWIQYKTNKMGMVSIDARPILAIFCWMMKSSIRKHQVV